MRDVLQHNLQNCNFANRRSFMLKVKTQGSILFLTWVILLKQAQASSSSPSSYVTSYFISI